MNFLDRWFLIDFSRHDTLIIWNEVIISPAKLLSFSKILKVFVSQYHRFNLKTDIEND